MLHIGQGYKAGFHSLFNNPDSEVSSHYVIYKDGQIEQWVEESDAAWHAGIIHMPTWPLNGRSPNRIFLGIEHEGFYTEVWTEEMYQSDLYLLRQIRDKYGIVFTRDNLIGHNELDTKNRVNCPGSNCPFDDLIEDLKKI